MPDNKPEDPKRLARILEPSKYQQSDPDPERAQFGETSPGSTVLGEVVINRSDLSYGHDADGSPWMVLSDTMQEGPKDKGLGYIQVALIDGRIQVLVAFTDYELEIVSQEIVRSHISSHTIRIPPVT